MKRSISVRVLLLAALFTSALPAAAEGEAPAPTPAEERGGPMEGVLRALAVVLPLSMDADAFADPANQTRVSDALWSLDQQVDLLRGHPAVDGAFAWLADALARDVQAAQWAYSRGSTSEAQEGVGNLVEHCVACHTRFPAADSNVGSLLFARMDTAAVGTLGQARLHAAVRQTDEALVLYERALLDPVLVPGGLDGQRAVIDYLALAIRARGDLDRPLPVLKRFATREDLAGFVRRDVKMWIASLAELKELRGAGSALDQARALVDEGRRRNEFPVDRDGLIHFLLASSMLQGFAAAVPRPPAAELAEAFYLLGIIEAQVGDPRWGGNAEFYLEACIRTAPGSPFADRALALLDWYLAVRDSGTAGGQMPQELKRVLDELRVLVGQAG